MNISADSTFGLEKASSGIVTNSIDTGSSDVASKLKSLKIDNKNNVMFSYLNVNSIRYKFCDLSAIIGNNVDVFSIAETKIDGSFTDAQFMLPGFTKPYRHDVSDTSGGLLTYINQHIPSRQLKHSSTPDDIQIIVTELKLRKHKWLLFTIYRPPSQNLKYFLDHLSLLLDFHHTYENIIIIGDFNNTPDSLEISSFMSDYDLYSFMNAPTCFKSREGRCIDLILTNKKHSFQMSNSFETGVSDHHHMIYTMLKQSFFHIPCKKMIYRSYKNFDTAVFKADVSLFLSQFTDSGIFSSLTLP